MADDVTKLPVKFKSQPTGDRTLEVVHGGLDGCNHIKNVTYIIDEAAAEVECGGCKAKLNPVWVLARLAHSETGYHETAARYQEEMARLSERSRTRCDACGQMTRISRR